MHPSLSDSKAVTTWSAFRATILTVQYTLLPASNLTYTHFQRHISSTFLILSPAQLTVTLKLLLLSPRVSSGTISLSKTRDTHVVNVPVPDVGSVPACTVFKYCDVLTPWLAVKYCKQGFRSLA